MLIFCEECGARNQLELGTLSTINKKSGTLKCECCGEALIVSPLQKNETRLELSYGGQVVEVSKKRAFVTLGRGPENDIVVDDRLVSRSHAVILCRKNRFVLIDESRNGTYVEVEGKEGEAVMRDEECTLSGKGVICPGRKPGPNAPDVIRFSLR